MCQNDVIKTYLLYWLLYHKLSIQLNPPKVSLLMQMGTITERSTKITGKRAYTCKSFPEALVLCLFVLFAESESLLGEQELQTGVEKTAGEEVWARVLYVRKTSVNEEGPHSFNFNNDNFNNV